MKKFHLKSHKGYWINRTRMLIHQAFENRLKAYGITIAQWNLLIALLDLQPASLSELANYIEVDKASVSRVVERLLNRELLEHLPARDKRTGALRLTKKGKALLEQLLVEAEKNESDFFDKLTAEENDQLGRLLAKILKNSSSVALDGWLDSYR